MTPSRWKFLAACLKVAHPQHRTVTLKDVQRELGYASPNATMSHAEGLIEEGLMRPDPVRPGGGCNVYVLTCSFILFEEAIREDV